jgi:hypothetical protein
MLGPWVEALYDVAVDAVHRETEAPSPPPPEEEPAVDVSALGQGLRLNYPKHQAGRPHSTQ